VSSDESNDSTDAMLLLSMFTLESPSSTARGVPFLLTMVINFTGFGTLIFLAIIDVGYDVSFKQLNV